MQYGISLIRRFTFSRHRIQGSCVYAGKKVNSSARCSNLVKSFAPEATYFTLVAGLQWRWSQVSHCFDEGSWNNCPQLGWKIYSTDRYSVFLPITFVSRFLGLLIPVDLIVEFLLFRDFRNTWTHGGRRVLNCWHRREGYRHFPICRSKRYGVAEEGKVSYRLSTD